MLFVVLYKPKTPLLRKTDLRLTNHAVFDGLDGKITGETGKWECRPKILRIKSLRINDRRKWSICAENGWKTAVSSFFSVFFRCLPVCSLFFFKKMYEKRKPAIGK